MQWLLNGTNAQQLRQFVGEWLAGWKPRPGLFGASDLARCLQLHHQSLKARSLTSLTASSPACLLAEEVAAKKDVYLITMRQVGCSRRRCRSRHPQAAQAGRVASRKRLLWSSSQCLELPG